MASGGQSVQWQFSFMTSAEMTYFTTTLLAGALSATMACQLWTDLIAEQNFTECILFKPVYQVWQAGLYRNVSVQVSHLLPLL